MRIECPRTALPPDGIYSELRLQKNLDQRIVLVNSDVMANNRVSNYGVSARTYKSGSWGFASSPDLSSASSVLRNATENSSRLHNILPYSHGPLRQEPSIDEFDLSTSKQHVGVKEKLAYLKELDFAIEYRYRELVSRTVVLSSLETEKHLRTSFGSDAYSKINRCHIQLKLDMERDGEVISLGRPFGGLGNFEDLFGDPGRLLDDVDDLVEHLRRKADGVQPTPGTYDVILNSNLAGILAHEAVGHTTEADLVKAGSVAGVMKNQRVGSELVTIVDYAWNRNGDICPVPVRVDDEGTAGRDVTIIEKGILRNYMHSKETARDFDEEPMGNGRASEYFDEPLVRMRNTAIFPGNDQLEDMIASIEDGYYLMDPTNGQADLTGEFMFGVAMGYKIRNGKLDRAIRDTTISGMAFEFLKNISMLSNEMTWLNIGMCGKKQMIPVGMGGPAVKCRIHVGGRNNEL